MEREILRATVGLVVAYVGRRNEPAAVHEPAIRLVKRREERHGHPRGYRNVAHGVVT